MEKRGLTQAVIIGAGNVATHLARALAQHIKVVQIFSRDISNASLVAEYISGCEAIDTLDSISKEADIYIVCVKDDAISHIADCVTPLCKDSALWLHTSGSVSADVFKAKAQNYGVLYPLQTFSKNVAVDISKVPFFIEGINIESEKLIEQLALYLSPLVNKANSSKRRSIHAAAVFACNFTNHLWSIASDILDKENLDFDVLLPLMRVTFEKASTIPPAEAQTGPARRGDTGTMLSHLEILDENKSAIYRMLSQSIMKQYNIQIDNEQNKL